MVARNLGYIHLYVVQIIMDGNAMGLIHLNVHP
jgi:hypothetical protein